MTFGMILLLTIWAVFALFAAWAQRALDGIVPAAELRLFGQVSIVYLLIWIASLGYVYRLQALDRLTRDQFFRYGMSVCWAGKIMLIAAFWVFAPYVTDETRLLVTAALLLFVMAAAMGTLRVPTRLHRGFLGTWLPILFPLGLGLWYATHKAAFASVLVLLMAVWAGIAFLFRAHQTNNMRSVYDIFIENEALRAEKARFLAAASHDLDQPLQSARLFFDQAQRGVDAKSRALAAERVGWAFDTMQDMIRQVTQHLKLDAGAVTAERQPVAVGPVLARVVELNEHAAAAKSIDLRTLPLDLTAIGDAALIERTINNFVINAIRHSKGRRVLAGARRMAGKVRLWVIDDGRGVPEADRAALFDEYTQGSDHQGEVRGGYGLGLASARRMAELMGGIAGLDPRWRKGSAFFLELPSA